MTREELKRHCEKQIEECERWSKHKGEEPHGKIYEEHKLILELLEQEPSLDGMEKHTDRQIYDGCIHMMKNMVEYFLEYLEYLGYDLDKLDEDERFAVGISNMKIVRTLFLSHTRNSGGCSTRDFCKKIGIDGSKSVKFKIERDEE
jgi:hypothetical protein